MIQYSELFPLDTKTFSLHLDRKTGSLPKGVYSFFDSHCAERKCDCRRVVMSVCNEKGKDLAHIAFGFDPDTEEAGPYLEPFMRQSRHAKLLLEIFTDMVNTEPDFLEHLYDHYRKVREKIDGRKYRGRTFPRPGSVIRVPREAPDTDALFEDFEQLLSSVVNTSPGPNTAGRIGKRTLLPKGTSRGGKEPAAVNGGRETVMALISLMLLDMKRKKMSGPSEAARMMEGNPDLAFPLIDLLAEEGSRPGKPRDDYIHACILLLRAVFERLRVDLERSRPGSTSLNEALQKHIADRMLSDAPASFLGVEAVRNLTDCRLEPLPLLAEAFQRMMTDSGNGNVVPLPGADHLAGILEAMAEIGAENVFNRFAVLTDQFRLAPEEMQLQLATELAVHESPVLREIAGLMSFHPLAGVREKFPAILASVGGDSISPETMRRLILTRNWHAEKVRSDIDGIVATARRAGVQCARVREMEITGIFASAVDGAGAQGIWIIARDKGRHVIASILAKISEGIIDAWVTPSMTAAESRRMVQAFKNEGGALPVRAWLVERVVGHGIATGLSRNAGVPVGLLEVADTLGISGWKPELIDPERLLASLRRELDPPMSAVMDRVPEESESWPMTLPLASSWFEDDREVDELLERRIGAKRLTARVCDRAVDAVVEEILQRRRPQWVERLALTTLWLTAVTGRPPLAPVKMLLVAEQVATAKNLGNAGLMRGVARMTVDAYLARRVEESAP